MKKLEGFLEKFSKITIPNESLRRGVSDTIKELFGVQVDIKQVSIKDGVAYISCSGPLKSEIFFKKQQILKDLEDRGVKGLYDIR